MDNMKKIRYICGVILYTVLAGKLPHYALGRKLFLSNGIRMFCSKLICVKCGRNVDLGRNCKLSSRIVIGDNSGIGDEAFFQGEIEIV